MSSHRKRRNAEGTRLLPFAAAADPLGGEPERDVPQRAPHAGTPRCVFLGWDRPALPAAADWLVAERGADMEGLLVALPGGRAVRRLADLLARRATPGWRPPRILTQGHLVDELCELERPPAGRLARTLAWRRALEALAPADLERLARGAGARTDAESRLRLAETIRTLHGELAPDGLDFAGLARRTAALGHAAESERWRVLARVQQAWRRALEECELADPHEGRRAALEAGRVDTSRDVVLVGVADMNELLAGVLARVGARATALVAAPAEHAAGFDELGRLVAGYWNQQPVPLDGRWFVEEKPGDQADRALDRIAEWSERHAAEEITVGLADDEVAPFLERRLREAEVTGDGTGDARGARLRVAAGTPLSRTRPFKLLRAACDLVERRGFADLAALARHPDLAGALGIAADAADVLDRYHERHVPSRLPGHGERWPGEPEDTAAVQRLSRGLDELLGELGRGRPAPLATWSESVRALLARVYGRDGRRLDPEVEEERVLAGALRAIAAALDELEALPPALAGGAGSDRCLSHEALRLLLRTVRAETVPPAPARPGEPTLEGLGWLELALDDAPAMVVTGFNEGRVPESIQGHAFLPNALRAALGLPDDDTRLARDVYATCALLAVREDVALVTGRRARNGDPLVPSRIAFQVPRDRPAEVLERVRRFLPPAVAPETTADTLETPELVLPRLAVTPPLESISVTAFRTYLESPYVFYLEKVLRLRTRDDRARELDPMPFGTFAHDVLQDLFDTGPRDSSDADELADFLVERVDARALARFGPAPQPAVALQLERLRYRMRLAAREQAARRAAGWRMLAAEWTVADGVPFDVDGAPVLLKGKLDRVDVHPDGRWAILDYKTGESATPPEETHRKGDRWKDLQLPLYRYLATSLAEEHGLAGAPELGYFQLGKDAENVGLRVARGWTDDDYESALEEARRVVRAVRDGELFARGRKKLYDEIFKALVGEGLLDAPRGPGGDDDEDDDLRDDAT